MNASKATEQSQDSKRQYSDLDSRYGKIGISAVAAAENPNHDATAIPRTIRLMVTPACRDCADYGCGLARRC